MVGRAGRCGGGWSVGSGLREQKGDQVGERQRGPGRVPGWFSSGAGWWREQQRPGNRDGVEVQGRGLGRGAAGGVVGGGVAGDGGVPCVSCGWQEGCGAIAGRSREVDEGAPLLVSAVLVLRGRGGMAWRMC